LAALFASWLVLAAVAGGAAAAPSPQRAIERLERCSAEELRQACVRILRQERVDDHTVRIKAEIRGGRIIWYQFDLRSGAIRRVN